MEAILMNIKNMISQEMIYIIIAIFVVVCIALLVLRSMRLKFAKKELDRLENKFDMIKGVPLNFKINKAVALARVNNSLSEKVFEAQQIFDNVNEEIKSSTRLLAEMDDLLYSKKHRQIISKTEILESQLDRLESDVRKVDSVLDEILSQESEKREQINRLKEQFRLLKQKIGIDKTKFYQGSEYIDKEITNIEKMFSLFEEWMFASEFEKASQQYDEINESLTNLNQYVIETPSIFEVVHQRIQKQMDSISYAYASYRNEGIYINHLGVKNNLELVSVVIKESISKLTKGNLERVKEELERCDTRLIQLSDQLVKEYEAHNEVKVLGPQISNRCFDLKTTTEQLKELYEKYHVRFSLEDYHNQINEYDKIMSEIEEKNAFLSTDEGKNVPATTYLISLKQLQENCESYDLKISKLKTLLQTVVNDEKRAQQQLVKLNLVVHEMGIKLSKSKISHIEEGYEEQIKKAKTMLNDTQKIIDASVVNVESLNVMIKDSIDYIYTLFNKISNYIGSAKMVENLIVFGNRYRSTYPDLDSQLTRSELYYRNGEFSKALQITVNAIEKVVPGTYERMINGNKKELGEEL